MKVANLANGHVLAFPDEAEDPHMDAAVQGYLAARGEIPPAVDPVQAMLQTLQQGFSEALGTMAHGLQTQISDMQQQNVQREHTFLQQLESMRQSDEAKTQAIVAALTSPKKIVHDTNGRPVGLTVGN